MHGLETINKLNREAQEEYDAKHTTSHLWKVNASLGACNALLNYQDKITDKVLINAEQYAVQRGREWKSKPTILRADVEKAILNI